MERARQSSYTVGLEVMSVTKENVPSPKSFERHLDGANMQYRQADWPCGCLNAQFNPGNSGGVDSPCQLTHWISGPTVIANTAPTQIAYFIVHFLNEDCRCLVDIPESLR